MLAERGLYLHKKTNLRKFIEKHLDFTYIAEL